MGKRWNGQECVDCESGRFSAVDTVVTDGVIGECMKCPEGTMGPGTGRTSCELCPAGKYQPESGRDVCISCDQNYYNPAKGQRMCLPCLPPATSDSTGATTCRYPDAPTLAPGAPVCPAGSIPDGTAFKRCAAGRVNQQQGGTVCQLCPTGRFSVEGAAICNECPEGSFAATTGVAVCSRCPLGKFSGAGATGCETCPLTIVAGTLAAKAPTCGNPMCSPTCTLNQLCRRESDAVYSIPRCVELVCNGCTATQRCYQGQCITPIVDITQDVVDKLDRCGIDARDIATTVDFSAAIDKDVFVAGGSITVVTTTDGRSGKLTFGSNDGSGQQPAAVVFDASTRSPELSATTDRGVVIVKSGSVQIDKVTVGGGGGSGNANLFIQVDQATVVVKSGDVDVKPDGAVFVRGPGTFDATVKGGSTVTVEGGPNGSRLRGDVTPPIRVEPDTKGRRDLKVDGDLKTQGDIRGQADIKIETDGKLTLRGPAQRVDGTVEVKQGGSLRIESDARLEATVDLTSGKTEVRTNDNTKIPYVEVIRKCDVGHKIEYTIPGVSTGAQLEKGARAGVIMTYGGSTVATEFECSVDLLAANGDRVTATVRGAATTGPVRRLLADDCNEVTWGSQSLNYTTCGNPNSAVSVSSSMLLLPLTLFSVLALLF